VNLLWTSSLYKRNNRSVMSPPDTASASTALRLPGDHFVQFYQDATIVIDKVVRRTAAALRKGSSSVIIATLAHRLEIEARLARLGIHNKANLEGRFIALDAAETLAKFMVDGWPDESRFHEAVGGCVAEATARSADRYVTAFGEMVALLCADGKAAAAIRLEHLWNDLGSRFSFSLFCAYPLSLFANDREAHDLLQVCAQHDLTIPSDHSW
jgi:hypothetical protein